MKPQFMMWASQLTKASSVISGHSTTWRMGGLNCLAKRWSRSSCPGTAITAPVPYPARHSRQSTPVSVVVSWIDKAYAPEGSAHAFLFALRSALLWILHGCVDHIDYLLTLFGCKRSCLPALACSGGGTEKI